MISFKQNCEIYFYRHPVDFRNGINGLSILVEDLLEQNPLSGDIFVFRSKRRSSIKILYWDKNGFCLWQKRLDQDKFYWPLHLATEEKIVLNHKELRWLLDGLNLKFWKPHQTLKSEKMF